MFVHTKEVVHMHLSTAIRARRAGLLAVAVLALAISLAACGSSSSSNGVASVGSKSSTTSTTPPPAGSSSAVPTADTNQLIKYSQCMRANGVPNFPDPTNGQLLLKAGPGTGLDPNSPAFQAAAQKCKSLRPAGIANNPAADAQLQAKGLQFAQCMRSHGVPNFPDPTFSGGGMRLQLKGNIDPNSPAFQKAQQDCGSLLPGGAP
jgi:hypothetical protein